MISRVSSFAKRFLLAYWFTVILIYGFTGWFLDLFTFTDSGKLVFVTAIAVLPLVAYSLTLVLPDLQWCWYGNLFMALIIFGLYLGSAYYTVKKLDLLWSVAVKPATIQQLQIITVNKVFAGRAGFDHTNVVVNYHNKPVLLEAGRSSYFLLQHKRIVSAYIGISTQGEYFARYADIPFGERWRALQVYWQDWITRYWWLGILILLFIVWDIVKSKLTCD